MNKSKKLTFKLFRGQNVPASRGGNKCPGGAKNEKSISEAACLLDRWEYSTAKAWIRLLLITAFRVIIMPILAHCMLFIIIK